jgi:hypothetical protein
MVAGAALTLAVEALLGLAFWGGSVWLAGALGWLWGGVSLAVAVVLLLMALLSGDLEAEYDTTGHRVDLRLGWIGRITSREQEGGTRRIIHSRVFFLRWTRVAPLERSDRGHRSRISRAPRSWVSRIAELAEPVSRAMAAAAPAMSDLLWDSREMTLRVQSPTQVGAADRALAGLFGLRSFGPLEIQFVEGGERALLARYRIRLYRAALIAIAGFVQGRPDRAMHAIADPGRPSHRRGEHGAQEE